MNKYYEELEQDIIAAYGAYVNVQEAEHFAGKFLAAQMQVSKDLRIADLDARMRKSGLKAVRATAYKEACDGAEKRPTEASLEHILAMHELVQREQKGLDEAEVNRDELQRLGEVFKQAHYYFSGMRKDRFS